MARLAGLAPVEVGLDVRLGEFEARRAAVNDTDIGGAVGFAGGGDGKELSDGISRHMAMLPVIPDPNKFRAACGGVFGKLLAGRSAPCDVQEAQMPRAQGCAGATPGTFDSVPLAFALRARYASNFAPGEIVSWQKSQQNPFHPGRLRPLRGYPHPSVASEGPHTVAAGSRGEASSETAAWRPRQLAIAHCGSLRPLPKAHSPRALGATSVCRMRTRGRVPSATLRACPGFGCPRCSARLRGENTTKV